MAMLTIMQGSSLSCGHMQAARPCRPAVSSINSLSSAFSGCALRQPSAARQPLRPCRQLTVARRAGAGGEEGEEEGGRRRGRGRDGSDRDGDRGGRGGRRNEPADDFQERLVQVRRVTKVVKGGKQLSFRAVVVVGDGKGSVGVGCASAKEIAQSVQRAVAVAKREKVTFPLNKAYSLPHRIDGYWGAAKVMLRPAADGAGVIAGGAVRVVLELAGVRNCFGKQLGSANPLNNARATVEGLRGLRTFKQVSQERGISVQELMGLDREPETQPSNAIAGAMAGAI